MQRRLRQRSTNRGDRETLVEAYTDFGTGAIVESREFLTRTFRIADERPQYQWRLAGEQAEFLGYVVQKATAVHDSTTIEADSLEVLTELLGHDDAFALGNHSRLKSLAKAYEDWNEDGVYSGSVEIIRQHVHAECERYPDDGEDSQRTRCLAFLS